MITDLKQEYAERAIEHNINLDRLLANINRIAIPVALSAANTQNIHMMVDLEETLGRDDGGSVS